MKLYYKFKSVILIILLSLNSVADAGPLKSDKTFILINNVSSNDPFKPYLTGKAPQIIKELGEEVRDSVRIRKFIFHTRDVKTPEGVVPSNLFAAIVRPVKPGNYPGMLVLHGGGGNAELDKAVEWAAQGYIALVLDEPGVANPDRANPESIGPWKKYAYGKNRFTTTPDITGSTVFDGVVACVQGLYLLSSQPDVIKDRIGIVGVSWGGYMTTIVTGLASSYVHASFSVFGSGFYDEGSSYLKELDIMSPEDRATWIKYLDAGRRAKNIKSPFFIAGAANDAFFYPPAVMTTLRAIKKNLANHLFGPNASHKILLPGGSTKTVRSHAGWLDMEQCYFDYLLKDKGQALPVITDAKQVRSKPTNKNIQIKFHVNSPTPITDAKVYYSFIDAEWTKRLWVPVAATAIEDGWYTAELPVETTEKVVDWYATVSDARPVSVSGYIFRSK